MQYLRPRNPTSRMGGKHCISSLAIASCCIDTSLRERTEKNHLLPRNLRPAGKAYCKVRVVGAKSLLQDSDGCQVQRVSLFILTLGAKRTDVGSEYFILERLSP